MNRKVQFLLWVFALVLFTCIQGCLPDPSEKNAENRAASTSQSDDIVEIVTTTMDFKASNEIPSGWITFRYVNNSAMTHFIVLERFPKGKGIKEHRDSLAPVFQNFMDEINGKPLSAPALGKNLPGWFGDIVFLGGVGFTSPGHTSESTLFLEPGTYVIECYIKSNGIFHSYNPNPDITPMVHQFTVTEKVSSGKKPKATVDVNISSAGGIEFKDNIEPGEQVFAVHFLDQKAYENFQGHDVHLLRFKENTNLDSVAAWLNWMNPKGLETPAPPAEFLGGVNEMPAGSTGYFHAVLTPGEYALFSEVPDPASHGMLRKFTVSVGN